MDKNVFISEVKLELMGNKLCHLKIEVFDKDNKVANFYTSLMTRYNAEKYEKQALELIGDGSWFKAIYGLSPHEFHIVSDHKSDKQIIALAHDKGMLLKNEVKIY